MRPIDADALTQELEKGIIIPDDLYTLGIMEGNDHAIKKVSAAPTLDVQPVRRGEWRYVNYQTDKTTWITGEFICRKCGKSIPRHMGDNPPDYCQHCGADMREVNTDDV